MTLIVVACHGEFAAGIASSLRMLMGEVEDFVTVEFHASEGLDDLLARYSDAVRGHDHDGVLFMVDLLGGSPYNAAARFVAERPDMDVVTGVNLPMIVETVGRRMAGTAFPELVEVARQAGSGGIVTFKEKAASASAAPSTPDDGEDDEL